MEEIMVGIIIWFVVSLIILLNYGRSKIIGKTTDPEHMAILLVCLPATVVITIVSLGAEILEFIRDSIR